MIILVLFSQYYHKNICCGYSLMTTNNIWFYREMEKNMLWYSLNAPNQVASHDTHNIFLWRKKKKQIQELSPILFL